jgi:outer membrane receptor for ferrienterochelin and colicins
LVYKLRYISFFCFFIFFKTSFSQENTELETFVVTAQYEKTEKDKAVNKVKVISREKIDAIAAVNLRDVLANENIIRISQDNILGSSMSLQGLSGQNVKILIDGVPVIGRLNGNVDLSQINLNNIERIEIVEGPLSVNYGTDALAGTINLISKKRSSDGISFNLNSYYESVGQYNLDGLISCKIKNGVVEFSAGRNFFDGWSPEDSFIEFPESRLADSSRKKQWNPKEQLFSKAQYSLVLDSQSLRIYFNHFDEKITNRGAPRAPYNETAFDDYYNTWRTDFGIDYNRSLKNGKLKLLAAFNDFKRIKNTFFKDLTTLEQQPTNSVSDQDTIKFKLLMSRGTWSNINSKLNYQIGYDLNFETSRGRRIEGLTKSQGDYAVFGSVKWIPLKNLVIKPALRLTYNSQYKAPPIPSLNIKYNLNKLIFRGSYAKGFRAPSLKEMYFNFVDINHNIVGNASLIAEQSNNFTADFIYKTAVKKTTLQFDFGGFYNDITNLITLAQSETNNQQYTYVNIGAFKTLGGQFNSSFKFKKLNVNFGFANIGRYNNLNTTYDVPSFSFSPELRSNIIYTNSKFNFRLAAFYKYTGKTVGFYVNSNDELSESMLSNFQLLDLNVTKMFKGNKIQWSLGVKNLFDVQSLNSNSAGGVHSAGSNSVPMSWGRSIFTAIKISFN